MAAQVASTNQSKNSLFTAFSLTDTSTNRHEWLLDSGCSTHVTGLQDSFTTYEQIPDSEHRIHIANNMELVLKGILHVPACGENSLLSVSQLRHSSIFVKSPPSGGATMRYSDSSRVEVMEANGLYVLRPVRGEILGHHGVNKAFAIYTGEGAAKGTAQWHFRLPHLGAKAVRKLLIEDNDIPSIRKVPHRVCAGYLYGKMAWKPFPSVLPSSRATQPLEIVHSNLAGLIDPKSLEGALYLLIYTDNFTRYKVSYLLKCISKALARFKEYKALVVKQQRSVIKKLRVEGEGEYISKNYYMRPDRPVYQRLRMLKTLTATLDVASGDIVS